MTKYDNINDFISMIKTNKRDLGGYLSILYEYTKMDDSTKTATCQSTLDLLSVSAVKWTIRWQIYLLLLFFIFLFVLAL